jgi:hypothetical protein
MDEHCSNLLCYSYLIDKDRSLYQGKINNPSDVIF